MADFDDYDLILKLASSSASLDASPKKNWVENAGGLPPYVRKLARGIMKSGKSKSQAIAIAISRIKKWAAGGGDVDADTKAKAAKALAQWEATKAKNKSKNLVAASYVDLDGNEETYLMLSYIPSFRMDSVRTAWNALENDRRRAERQMHENSEYVSDSYRYIREQWSDFILVEAETENEPLLAKIPYTVHPITHEVTFGAEVPVRQVYIEMDEELTDAEAALLADLI